jgi:hypothetical protein
MPSDLPLDIRKPIQPLFGLSRAGVATEITPDLTPGVRCLVDQNHALPGPGGGYRGGNTARARPDDQQIRLRNDLTHR